MTALEKAEELLNTFHNIPMAIACINEIIKVASYYKLEAELMYWNEVKNHYDNKDKG